MLARKRLLGILSGAWVAQAVYAVVKLGVPDLLSGGPATSLRLASQTGASPQALERLLRALCGVGLFTEPERGTFGLTSSGQLLQDGVEGSVRLNALMQGDEVYRSFAEIMHSVTGNGPAFEKVYGQPFYQYLENNPEAAQVFNASMADEGVPVGLQAIDLSWAESIVDVGGGDGSLLRHILRDGQRGVLLELPSAIAAARVRLADLADRVTLVEGSFFDQVPLNGDLYVLSRVLHNWSDENAARILARIHEAIPAHGRLIVLDEFRGGLIDLLMLVTVEGRDRTEEEYRALVQSSGFAVIEAGEGVLLCERASI